jgi:hypothetical protein
VYDGLEPWKSADANGHLLAFVHAIAGQLQDVTDLVRDSDTAIGWSSVVDLDRAPSEALAWLGQFVGVTVSGDLDDASQRIRIRETQRFQRGTVAALQGAARQFLTGGRTVHITERDTSPYHLKVTTFVTETVDSGLVDAALQAGKPAGLVLDYEVSTGATYGDLKTTGMTYAELGAMYATYGEMKLAVPS